MPPPSQEQDANAQARKAAPDPTDSTQASPFHPPPPPPPFPHLPEELLNYYRQLDACYNSLRQEQARMKQVLKKEDAHIWGLSNPVKFPAKLYTVEVFKVNQPFVTLVSKPPPCAVVQKSGKRRMSTEVLRCVMQETLSERLINTEAIYYSKMNGELTTRPWHLALVEGLMQVTKPSPASVRAVADAERELKAAVEVVLPGAGEEEEGDAGDDDESEDDDDEKDPDYAYDCSREDLQISLSGQQTMAQTTDAQEAEEENKEADDEVKKDTTSRESMHGDHEEQKSDIALEVRLVKDKKGTWCYVLVVECKHSTTWTEDAVFQALKYACDRGMLNFKAGYVLPVHVTVVTESEWSYAVVDVYGAVSIGKNGVLQYDEFEKLVGGRKHGRATERKSCEALEKSLHDRRKFMRAHCQLIPDVDYEEGDYLVGDVYIDPKRRKLPKTDSIGDFMSSGALLYYEALLRIIVGDRVLRWTVADVHAALETRSALVKRKVRAITNLDREAKRTRLG